MRSNDDHDDRHDDDDDDDNDDGDNDANDDDDPPLHTTLQCQCAVMRIVVMMAMMINIAMH